MAKKKIDLTKLTPFLLEKGERVGLYAAAGLSLLLVAMGVLRGMSAGSATENAKVLEAKISRLEQAQAAARPGPQDKPKKIGEDPLKASKTIVVRSENYRSRPLFYAPGVKDTMRQQPVIYAPDQFFVEVVRTKLEAVAFEMELRGDKEVPVKIAMFKPGGGDGQGDGENGNSIFGGQAGETGQPKPRPKEMGKHLADVFKGRTQAISFGRAGARGAALPRGITQTTTPRPRPGGGNTVEWKPLTEAEKEAGGFQIATTTLPLRMAVVTATFPYKEQVEEFRRKLLLDSHGAVLTERVRGEDGQIWNSFQFRNVLVQRAVVQKGKPLEWEDVPVDEAYKWIAVRTLKQFEEENPRLAPIREVSRGLVMALPKQMDERRYADVIPELPNLQATLDKLAQAGNEAIIAPSSRFDPSSFNAFDIVGGTTTDKGNDPPPDPGNAPFIPGQGEQTGVKETSVDHCMVRFIDVTLKPGQSYRYRVKVVMANPNYMPEFQKAKHTYPNLAREKELESPWVEVPQEVVVPPDGHLYAVDQKTIDGATRPQHNPTHEAVFQIHRWFDEYRPDATRSDPEPVGDWVIAESVVVRRGEYVRHLRYKAPVPVKPLNSLAPTVDDRAEVEFGDESILVDFEGGYTRFSRPDTEDGKTRSSLVDDRGGIEVLVMTPDGRVYSRVNNVDAANPERIARLSAYQRVVEAHKKKDSDKDKDRDR